MSSPPSPRPANRWMLKDVDFFAGFAHAIHTYLGGIALAHAHGMGLLHRPFQSAHGMGFHFDDFLMNDERVLASPLAAPMLEADSDANLMIDGKRVTVSTLQRTSSAAAISSRLRSAPANSLTVVRKGRFAFSEENSSACVNCTVTPEVRYAALWMRERFWMAVRALEAQQARAGASEAVESSSVKHSGVGGARVGGASVGVAAGQLASSSASASHGWTIRIAVHVRRGDVTWLDRYGRPSSRWVETEAMLEALAGVREAIELPLLPPAVAVDVYSESKGWLANDTAALRAVAPAARLHLDSTPAATINALTAMSRADILLMGASGFSMWAGIFSCGIKIGPAQTPMLPMRHVAHSNSLVSRTPFGARALPALRREWAAYARCKRDAACVPTLCAVSHVRDQAWLTSPLANEYALRPLAAQWHVPAYAPRAAPTEPKAVGALAARADGTSTLLEGWRAVRAGCARERTHDSHGPDKTCARKGWSKQLSLVSLKQRKSLRAAAVKNASTAGSPHTLGLEQVPTKATKLVTRDGQQFVAWAY